MGSFSDKVRNYSHGAFVQGGGGLCCCWGAHTFCLLVCIMLWLAPLRQLQQRTLWLLRYYDTHTIRKNRKGTNQRIRRHVKSQFKPPETVHYQLPLFDRVSVCLLACANSSSQSQLPAHPPTSPVKLLMDKEGSMAGWVCRSATADKCNPSSARQVSSTMTTTVCVFGWVND